MLRVLIDSGNAPPNTGIGVYGQGLLHALEQYCSDRISASESGISVVGKTFRPVWRIRYLIRLQRLARKDYLGADVVHFTNIYVPKKRNKVAYVVTIHDLNAVEHPELHTWRYTTYYRNAVQRAVERADKVITDTNSVRQIMIERYRIPEDKIFSVGIGLHPDFKKAVDAVPTLAADETRILLFVGRLEPKKNIAWLIRAVSEGLKSRHLSDVKLILAGNKGIGFEEIGSAIAEAGPHVQWVTNPDTQILASLYKRASAIVLPSLCEGYGLPLIEAMYCDRPIVASRIPTSVEVAGCAAEFFSLGNKEEFWDAVIAAFTDVNAQQRKRCSSEQLKKYSWEYLAGNYAAVYEAARSRG